MSFWNQAGVSRITGMNAEESQKIIRLPDFMSRLYACNNLAEDTISHKTILMLISEKRMADALTRVIKDA